MPDLCSQRRVRPQEAWDRGMEPQASSLQRLMLFHTHSTGCQHRNGHSCGISHSRRSDHEPIVQEVPHVTQFSQSDTIPHHIISELCTDPGTAEWVMCFQMPISQVRSFSFRCPLTAACVAAAAEDSFPTFRIRRLRNGLSESKLCTVVTWDPSSLCLLLHS